VFIASKIQCARTKEDREAIRRKVRPAVEWLLWQRTPLPKREDENDWSDYYTMVLMLEPIIMDVCQNRMMYDQVNEAIIHAVINRGVDADHSAKKRKKTTATSWWSLWWTNSA
jgi:hypothetical protein